MAWSTTRPAEKAKIYQPAHTDPILPISSTNPIWPRRSTASTPAAPSAPRGRRDFQIIPTTSSLSSTSTSFTSRARAHQLRLPQQTQLHRPHGKATLLSLPLALRQEIWSQAICATSLLRVPPYFATPEAYPSLLAVSRQVRRDALSEFWSGNRFLLLFGQEHSTEVLSAWLQLIGPAHVIKLRNLVFLRRDSEIKLDVHLSLSPARMELMPMVPLDAGEEAKLHAELEPLLPTTGNGFTMAGLEKFFWTLHHRSWEKKGV